MSNVQLELVKKAEDINDNISTLDKYIQTEKDPENEFAMKLIQRGICFVRIKSSDGYKFFPSRFIGYKGNSYDFHALADDIDGRETNRAITKVLGVKLEGNSEYDKQYVEYCRKLGFRAREKGSFGVVRKFWVL